ncbi:TetR/AcrR family transcriptional regulator [Streptosporangium sp. DT93]|uniref:TetR/AcrR family transcriptional regulator n=1 Tax=Streptosporangium sp. DT93 TaxID=3393428 RepID=UPI003CE675F5
METTDRRRAPGMSPERRREMIVAVALPLIAERGATVTTGQIARAAGIGEATIFRVFADKDELFDACMAEALRPDHVLEQLAAIPLEQPLTGRLVDAVDAMRAHLARIGSVAGALHASGHRSGDRPGGGRPAPGEGAAGRPGREDSFARSRAALAELFEPDRESLRLPPERLASLFQAIVFAGARGTGDGPELSSDLVDVFVHGALT